jgi:hypothetical protein
MCEDRKEAATSFLVYLNCENTHVPFCARLHPEMGGDYPMDRGQEYWRKSQQKRPSLLEEMVHGLINVVAVRPGTYIANRFIQQLEKLAKWLSDHFGGPKKR